MSKVVLDDVISGYGLSKINENFQKIEDELNNKVLYRDNPVDEINTIEQDLDLNGFSLYNVEKINNVAVDTFTANVDTVASSIDSVNTVATNIANVNIVAGIDDDVTTVSEISTDIQTLSQYAPDISGYTEGIYENFASNVSGKGAELVEYQNGTVETALDARIPEINNYSALRNYSGSLSFFNVKGRSSLFDGGQGIFRIDTTDTTSADNGGTILIDSLNRRWKRDFSGKVNVKWFASGDGVTDDTSAIIAANSFAAASGSTLFFPASTYYVGGRTSAITPSTTWEGESHWYNHFSIGYSNFQPPDKNTIIDGGSANYDVLSGNLTAIEILNITFKGSGTGAHINMTSGTRMFRVFGCSMYGKEHAIKLSGSVAYLLRFQKIFTAKQTSHSIYFDWGTGSFNDIAVSDCWVFRPDGNGIYATGSSGGCTELNIIDNSVTDGTGSNTGIAVALVQGCRIVGNDIEGWGAIYSDPDNLTGKTGYQTNARAIQISGSAIVLEGNVTYGGGNGFSPVRLLGASRVRIGPNRILKDLSTQTYALSVDATSNKITIDPQQYDYPTSTVVESGATEVINNSTGNPSSNTSHTFNGAITINNSAIINSPLLLPDTVTQVASATNISLPEEAIVEITGNTNILNITGLSRRIVTLIFTGTPTLLDSPPGAGNLRLNGDFVATTTSTITLLSTGVGGSWREICRSTNG